MTMPNPTASAKDSGPAPAALAQALDALKTYDRGSGRAALLPLDQAVAAASIEPEQGSARSPLERQLAAILGAGGSDVAREYICSKLALIGTERSVPALRELLDHPQLATAARTALEALSCPEAARGLRESLPALKGLPQLGAINSLGNRPDAQSAGALIPLLKDSDPAIAGAAAAALGNIGSVEAGAALVEFCPKAPEPLRAAAADAALTCAERLLNAGRPTEAQALYDALAGTPWPPHVRQAAQRGKG